MIRENKGFTLVEIMVAMVVLAIGLLGMAAMTVLVMKGGRGASDMTAATNICQLKMEELKNVTWDSLGNAGNWDASAFTNGRDLAKMVQQSGLNSQGKDKNQVKTDVGASTVDDPAVTALGPYKYTRTFVICSGKDYTSGSPNDPPAAGKYYVTPIPNQKPQEPDCNINYQDDGSRTEWLACKSNDITGQVGNDSREKKIKVLCAWRDRSGDCHSVHMDTTVVKLN